MLVLIFLVSAVVGVLSFLIFIGSSLPIPGLSVTTMGMMVLLFILWSWSAGALPGRRRIVHAVRDRAMLPGPPDTWDSEWINVPAFAVSADDIAQCSFTTCLLVKWVAFLGSLHWPAGGGDLGVGGISYVELLILYELRAGERVSLEKARPVIIQFQCRLFFLVQALIFGVPVVSLVP